MGEINHFSHEKHPLKLIENWETVLGVVGDNEGKKGVVDCKGCREPISTSGGSVVYGCFECGYFLHKTCAELPPTINHHFHHLHLLTLIVRNLNTWYCDVCRTRDLSRGFSYCCLDCDFDACTKCGVIAVAQEAAAIALKKEASIKMKHKGHHPQHSLTLQLRPAAFCCDACKTEEKDLFYQCDSCDFWIHKGCASLAPTIDLNHHHHPLVLVYSLPENCYKFLYYCDFCDKQVLHNDWLYHCANCRYFAHIKCALNAPPPRDDPVTFVATDKDLLHFPMSYSFTDTLKLLYGKVILDDNETYEINHWSHPDHLLILNEESQGNNKPDIDSSDLIEVCYGCVRPLSFPYYSCCEDGCSYTLHKYCELPRTLPHQLHPHHSLDLVNTWGDDEFYECTGCWSCGNTFVYKCNQTNCNFSLCVNCAFLPNTIKHESHKHPLVQLIDPSPLCKACNTCSDGINYSCKDCDFQLGMRCAMRSPHSLTHRYCKGHEIPLTYSPVEDHPEDFYCDICEKEMHPKFWLYHCHRSKSSFHLDCISRIDWYANIIRKGELPVSYHKHPLTFVRRQKGMNMSALNVSTGSRSHNLRVHATTHTIWLPVEAWRNNDQKFFPAGKHTVVARVSVHKVWLNICVSLTTPVINIQTTSTLKVLYLILLMCVPTTIYGQFIQPSKVIIISVAFLYNRRTYISYCVLIYGCSPYRKHVYQKG